MRCHAIRISIVILPAMFFRLSVLFLVCLQFSACSQFLFVPIRQQVITPDILGILHENIHLPVSETVTLHGWKLISADNQAGTILFLHGNGDNVSTHFANAYWLVERGYDVYLFDYRGYGLSNGEVGLDETINDIDHMIAYCVNTLPEGQQLIVMGHSLGASMAIYNVSKSPYKSRIRALVSINAFSDYHDVTRDVLSRSWLFWAFQWPLSFAIDNTYRPLDVIADISPVPLLLLQSRSDQMIEPYHSQRLFATARQPKQLLAIEGDHNQIFNHLGNRELLIDYLKALP